MFEPWTTVLRAQHSEAQSQCASKYAVTILKQRVLDAAKAVSQRRMIVAQFQVQVGEEESRLAAVSERRKTLETGGAKALEEGREDLAREAALLIHELASDEATTQEALDRLRERFGRQRAQVAAEIRRLAALRRGARLAILQDGLPASSPYANLPLTKAEDALRLTEARVETRQAIDQAREELDPAARATRLSARLDAAGCGEADPIDAILDTMRASLERPREA